MSIHNNMLTVLLPIACFLSNISFSSIVPFSSICNTYILYFLLIFFIHGLLYFLFLTFISLFLYFSSFPHYCFSFFTVSFSFTVFLFSSGHSSMPLSQHSKQHEWQAIATQWPPQTPPTSTLLFLKTLSPSHETDRLPNTNLRILPLFGSVTMT